jgi:heme-degrading monooxygenase HmoA
MYARCTTVQADPQRIDRGIAYIRDEVMPAVQSMPGCSGLSMLCDRDSGRCIVTTSWDSEESMSASRDAVRAMREEATEVMGGSFDVQEWEIVVVHRAHAMGEGACARVIYSQLHNAGQADRVIDAWKSHVLPRLDEFEGFSSVSLMADRSTGRGVSTVAFDSREAMERGREMGDRMREEFSSAMDVDITDVLEMEVAIHHLRVPEMA